MGRQDTQFPQWLHLLLYDLGQVTRPPVTWANERMRQCRPRALRTLPGWFLLLWPHRCRRHLREALLDAAFELPSASDPLWLTQRPGTQVPQSLQAWGQTAAAPQSRELTWCQVMKNDSCFLRTDVERLARILLCWKKGKTRGAKQLIACNPLDKSKIEPETHNTCC